MHVLVFDDQPQYLTWIEDLMESQGGSSAIYNRLYRAVRALHEDPVPDLIISDICAGGVAPIRHEEMRREWTGLEFIHQARERFPDTPIVAYTGASDPALSRILNKYDAWHIAKDDLDFMREILRGEVDLRRS